MLRNIRLFFILLIFSRFCNAEVTFNKSIRPILSNKCFHCHGPDDKNREADLRLDTFKGATEKLKHGRQAIIPGKPEKSELIVRVTTSDVDDLMPPQKSLHGRLSQKEISTLTQWIKEGATYQKHWSFMPVAKVNVPKNNSVHPNTNEIDAFIEIKLKEKNIKGLALAEPATQLRRLYLDLTGLLPEPNRIQDFIADPSFKHYQKIVDDLLSSPHYAERWARHWLDQARYADSNGYSHDKARYGMWIYRDWVIQAIDKDMPFDQFTIEQLAGDRLPNASQNQIIATAFNRNTMINTEGGVKPEQFRVEATVDRVNTVGQVWLGLTMECASCHTHKFDPITQDDYYRMFAYFNQASDANSIGKRIQLLNGEKKKELDTLKVRQKELNKAYQLAKKTDQEPDAKKKVRAIQRQISMLVDPHSLMVMEDLSKKRKTHLLERGDYRVPGYEVQPGTIAALPALKDPSKQPDRLDLAKWLVQDDHPLTSRVTVNRVWMRYFGRGLVETEEDFGSQGTPPTHPELLDWLSNYFMDSGWSLDRVRFFL